MQIAKSIILPEVKRLKDFEDVSKLLKDLEEAIEHHNVVNYEDALQMQKKFVTGRIQSVDGNTYFDLDTGIIHGVISFAAGTTGMENIDDANTDDWDAAYGFAAAVASNPELTLINGNKIATGTVLVGGLNADVVARLFSSSDAQDNIEAWMHTSDATLIDGGKIYTGSIVAGSIKVGTITGDKLADTTITGGKIANTTITGGKIATGAIDTDQLAAYAVTAGKIEANAVTASKIDVESLSAISATLGTVSSGTISSSKINLTTSTSYSLYFTSSGCYVYDGYSAHGAPSVTFYKSGLKRVGITLGSAGSGIEAETKLVLVGGGTSVTIGSSVLTLPNLGSAPSGVTGGICMVSGQLKYWNGSSWVDA